MASEVGIANSALRKIGARIITSFDDGTASANFISDRYADSRDELLRSHPWNFATKRALLARESEAPAFEYTYFNTLPVDWLRTLGVFDNDTGHGHIDYREEVGKIASNAEAVYLLYIYQVTDPATMPPDFREALAYRLAMDGAVPLASSNSLFDLMRERYEAALATARSVDAMANPSRGLPRGTWVTRRGRARSSWPMYP